MADQETQNQELARALQVISLAQQTHPKEYAPRLVKFLATLMSQKIPWDYDDPRFVEAIQQFVQQLAAELFRDEQEQKLLGSVPKEFVDAAATIRVLRVNKKRAARDFSKKLVTNFITQLERDGPIEHRDQVVQRLGQSVEQAIPAILSQTTTPQAALERIGQHLERAAGALVETQAFVVSAQEQVAQAAKAATAPLEGLIPSLQNQPNLVELVATTPTPNVAAFTRAVIERFEAVPATPAEALVRHATMVSRAASILNISAGDVAAGFAELEVHKQITLFRDHAQTFIQQKLIAPLADAVLTVTPKAFRDAAFSAIFSKSIDQAFQNITQQLGAAVAARIAPSRDQLLNVVGQHGGAGTSILGGLGKLFGDVFGAFRGGLDENISGYLLAIGEGKPVWKTLIFATNYTAFTGVFSGGVVGPSWSWVRTSTAALGKKVLGGVAGKAAGTALGKLFGSVLGALTGIPIIGPALGALFGEKVLGAVWGGAKKLFSGITSLFGLGGSILGGLGMGGSGTRTDLDREGQKLTAVLVVGGIIFAIFFLIVYPFFSISSHVAGPIAQSAVGGGDDESYLCDASDPACPKACDSNDPAQQCGWPMPCGCITQEAYAPGGSHARANALDIGVKNCQTHTDVTATHAGTVTDVFDQLSDGDKSLREHGTALGPKYGNYVIVQTPGGMQTIYAHLSRGTIAVSVGQKVAVGAAIGQTDDNGSSSGEHLHYEIRRGPKIETTVPQVPKEGLCWGTTR